MLPLRDFINENNVILSRIPLNSLVVYTFSGTHSCKLLTRLFGFKLFRFVIAFSKRLGNMF